MIMLHLFVESGTADEKFGRAIDSKQENCNFPSQMPNQL